MSDITYNGNNAFVPIEISAPMVDMSKLEGRYSESFVNMIAAAITPEIERLASVEGLAASGVRLHLVFAPETYMEHTSESVTYRRLLISYGQGAPRDLWVRWVRLDAEGEAYSLSDTPSEELVKIEIGEDVPQKIREKEYRFLARTSPDKYRAAMGKRNVTEWRELIKRAVKNGDLARVTKTVEISEETAALSDKLAAVLGITETVPVTSEPEVREDDDIAALARAALGLDTEEINEVSFVEPAFEDEQVEEVEDIFEDELTEKAEEVEKAEEAEDSFEDEEAVEADEPIDEVYEAVAEEKSSDVSAYTVPDEPTDEEIPVENEALAAVATVGREELEERIRAELEAKIRLEYESRARAEAEREAERLRLAAEELRLENERLRESARLENEKREAERVANEERIRAELEVKLRDESRERERLAEAARVALYEREMLEAERRADAERREAEEKAERERLEREKAERERKAEAERLQHEAEERANASAAAEKKYTYTKKTVLLLFRRSVDPNVTARIHEIIKATIDYYGKADVYIRIKASLPDSTTVRLDFVEIPVEELELLTNIIKVLGNSGLGIAKAKIQ